MRESDRYLQQRKGWWHYVRRVPKRFSHIDKRRTIRVQLETRMIEIARMRREAMEKADDLYWQSLASGVASGHHDTEKKYKAAQARAVALGFAYRTSDELVKADNLPEIVRRVAVLERSSGNSGPEFEALLGGVHHPRVKISDALETYLDVIAPMELRGKSAKQIRSWKKTPKRAVNNFINVVGDKPIAAITRDDTNRYFDWWQGRVLGTANTRKVSGNTANRDIGNMRKIYRLHFQRIGEETRPNPFRDMVFPDRKIEKKPVYPFDTDWLKLRFLDPGSWVDLNRPAFLIVMAMIETGCRPSEICNLSEARIFLDAEIPYIKIDYEAHRAIKTDSSIRDIPLVGVSLAAMRLAPRGFAKYCDREDTLSATLMKHFRRKNLLPSENHRVYSIRHSFEKRMLEAGIDADLRAKLFGHAIDRPEYGDAGSLAFRREQLEKMVFEVPVGLF